MKDATNAEISAGLRRVAAAYAMKDEKKFHFQMLAYQKAADVVEGCTSELRDLYKEGKLPTLPGIGASIQSHLVEFFATGRVKHFEEVLAGIPEAVFPLLAIPGFGPKKAFRLVSDLHLQHPETVIDDLAQAAREGRIAHLEGFGEKSQQALAQAIAAYRRGQTKTARMALPYAEALARKLEAYLRQCPDVIAVYPLGSLRRRAATIGDIDLAVATYHPQAVLTHFSRYPHTERLLEQGERTATIVVSSGRHIDLMTQPPEGFGALLQHFTGSKAHNIHLRDSALAQGLSLSEYGIKKKGDEQAPLQHYDTEEALYGALGMQWIPPEMREDTGEIELARQHRLPEIVELQDIKGDLHLHSAYPIEPSHDLGQDSMEAMIEKAITLNYKYIGFSEHNPSVSQHTPQQVYEILRQRNTALERLRSQYQDSIHIFSLLEVDIQPSGELAIDASCLELLDAVLVSVHSSFDMDRQAMTARILRGLAQSKARILAHPTGRLLNQRAGYEVEWEHIFAFCRAQNKALEINSWPQRLDLPDVLVRQAIGSGVRLFIHTDSHAVSHMDLMEYGVSVARRGWATRRDIVNTWPYEDVAEWLRSG
jgi:DNA polymerase (family X)